MTTRRIRGRAAIISCLRVTERLFGAGIRPHTLVEMDSPRSWTDSQRERGEEGEETEQGSKREVRNDRRGLRNPDRKGERKDKRTE